MTGSHAEGFEIILSEWVKLDSNESSLGIRTYCTGKENQYTFLCYGDRFTADMATVPDKTVSVVSIFFVLQVSSNNKKTFAIHLEYKKEF